MKVLTHLSCMPMPRLWRKFPPKAMQSWEVRTAWIHPAREVKCVSTADRQMQTSGLNCSCPLADSEPFISAAQQSWTQRDFTKSTESIGLFRIWVHRNVTNTSKHACSTNNCINANDFRHHSNQKLTCICWVGDSTANWDLLNWLKPPECFKTTAEPTKQPVCQLHPRLPVYTQTYRPHAKGGMQKYTLDSEQPSYLGFEGLLKSVSHWGTCWVSRSASAINTAGNQIHLRPRILSWSFWVWGFIKHSDLWYHP